MENEAATGKHEELAAKIKTLEQENLVKEQEITSLTHKNTLLEADVEKLEKSLHDAKSMVEDGAAHGSANETLQRKLQLLEEEAETTEKQLRETNEKYVHFVLYDFLLFECLYMFYLHLFFTFTFTIYILSNTIHSFSKTCILQKLQAFHFPYILYTHLHTYTPSNTHIHTRKSYLHVHTPQVIT